MKWFSTLNTALVTFLLTGCATEFGSIQSSQLTFVRNHILSNIDRGPQPGWVILWLGEERPVYAVNSGSQVLFANESGDFVRFYGNQIVEARNLLPGETIVHIEPQAPGLHYRINGNSIGTHACRMWEVEPTKKNSVYGSFVQKCSHNQVEYVNRVSVNQDRQLVRLIYFVHPEYPPVRLELAAKRMTIL